MSLQTKTFSLGSFAYQSDSNGYVLDLVLTEESVNSVDNTSQVSYKLQLRSGENNRFTAYIGCTVTLAGQTAKKTNIGIDAAYNHTYTLLTGTVTVTHNDDGSLDMAFSASIDTPASNPYAPPDMTLSGTMAMTAIARESVLAATSAYIGDGATIAVSRKSGNYTHSIFYQFGDLSGYLADNTGTHSDTEVKLTDTTLVFPIPEAFYGQIPDAPSGICTLICTTYSGDTVIGQPKTATFTVTADPARCSPILEGTAKDINETTLKLTGDGSVLVQGRSVAECILNAQAQQSAAISALYVNGVQIEGSSHQLEGITTAVITFRAVDSRGYSTEYTVPGLSLVPYVPLSFNISARRKDPTSGNADLIAQGKWYNGSFGAVVNTLTAMYKIGDGDWIEAVAESNGGDLTVSQELSGLDYKSSHTIQVQISDALDTVTKSVSVSKGIPVFDWGETDFAFHVPVLFTATDGSVFQLDLADGQLTAQII